MKALRAIAIVFSVLVLGLAGPAIEAKDQVPTSVTVAFGSGLNFNQPGNILNHHILPQEIKVRISKAKRLNGEVVSVPATVNFVVNGFHWIWAYKPGVKLQDLEDFVGTLPTPPPLFLNFDDGDNDPATTLVYAKGVFPGTPPAFTDGGPFPQGFTHNRSESIGFTAPGRYLVICNVRPHFVDGMYAWVRVVDDDDDDDDDHGGHR